MRNIDKLNQEYKMNLKSRTEKHVLYPARFPVSDDKVNWNIPFPEYNPVEFNAPVVLNPATPWADPQDISKVTHGYKSFEGIVAFNENRRPLNPFGRTGISGRGVVGKWGANFAADAVITTYNPQEQLFYVLTITRQDTGETAFPGGMIDKGEDAMQAHFRELNEEISLQPEDLKHALYQQIIFRGYINDPRNTDNAWMETTAIHTHLDFELAQKIKIQAGDDAAACHWTEINSLNIQNFYANHSLVLLIALEKLEEANLLDPFSKNIIKNIL
jgi:ADP-ribose pyrophosphatase